MNIGIVTTWFDRGAAYVSRAYLEALSKLHNVYIYARGGEKYGQGDPNWDKPYVTWGKKTDIGGTNIGWEDYCTWIKKNNIEVVIFNEQHDWEIIVRSQKLNILLGAYIDYYTPEAVPFHSLFDFLLCNTNRHYEVFKWHPQCLFIPWGTDTDLYKPTTKPDLKDGIIFFHSAGMGGVNLRKGTDTLVRAFQNVSGNAKLIIHSQVSIDYYGNEIAEIILRDKRIEFIEGTFPPPGLYYLGHVYVYPSKLEGIGLTICEALASGLPVITTNEPPMNEFIYNGINGFLLDLESTTRRYDNYYWPEVNVSQNHLTEIMQSYISDNSLYLLQTQMAREYVEKERDWYINSSGLNVILKELSYCKNDLLKKEVIKFNKDKTIQYYLDNGFKFYRNKNYPCAIRNIVLALKSKPIIRNKGVYSVLAHSIIRYYINL